MVLETDNKKWNARYIELAKLVSTWSKDPSTQVGAVAIGEIGQILSTGYNGFPRGIEDTEDRLTTREIKYSYTVHAEMNAIYNASFSGVSLKNSTVYVYGLPICSECAKGLIQAGVKNVVVDSSCMLSDAAKERWKQSWESSQSMFNESGVRCTII